jgi:hypothetical protein
VLRSGDVVGVLDTEVSTLAANLIRQAVLSLGGAEQAESPHQDQAEADPAEEAEKLRHNSRNNVARQVSHGSTAARSTANTGRE